MSTPWDALKERNEELDALGGASALLEWDQQTTMPEGAAASRGRQATALGKLLHQRAVEPVIGEWIAALDAGPLDATQTAAVRLAGRRYRRATCIPSSLVEALTEARHVAFHAWMEARRADDFSAFEAPLQRLIDLVRQQVDCYGYADHPYDALLEDYDPGSTVAALRPMFTRLGDELRTFLAAIEGRPHPADWSPALDIDGQKRLSARVLTDLGFDKTRGRLDVSEHPFTIGLDPTDVRITTHYRGPSFVASLGGTVHEAGHGLYEQGLRTDRPGTGLDRAAGMGLHESQSRFWENFIGRSRPFCAYLAPRMAGIWPDLAIDPDVVYGALNRVERSLIRVQADEATYNLHILARFELELGVVEGRLQAADLPAAWDEAYRRHVGVVAERPSEGVLQDVHWSGGLFGYFPSYTIGNLWAASLGATIEAALPTLWDDVAAGRFGGVLGWLREHVHRRGAEVDAPDIIRDAVGDRDAVSDFVDHLWRRHGALYGVSRG